MTSNPAPEEPGSPPPDHTSDRAHSGSWAAEIQRLKASSFKGWFLISLFQALGKLSVRPRLALGWLLGKIAPLLMPRRARIVSRNLEMCFPERDQRGRQALFKAHFRALAQTIVDRGLLWFGTSQAIEDAIDLVGHQHLLDCIERRQPVLLLAPHFVALDAAATRLTMMAPNGGTLYSPQRDPDVDALVRLGRTRFNEVHLVSRKEGVRGLIRLIKANMPIYYLPDMDFGARGAVFVPFFGVAAATQTATAQLARQFHLPVLPVLSWWNPHTGRYRVEVLPQLATFPDPQKTPEQDTAHLNELLEGWIRQEPSQYYWVHRRFKTRPNGEPEPYSKRT